MSQLNAPRPDQVGAFSDLEQRLAQLAEGGATESYGAMARALGLRMGELTAALEALMRADHAAGRPLRAALCEARLGNGLPARGFFDLAAELGHDVTNEALFTQGQRRALWHQDFGSTSRS